MIKASIVVEDGFFHNNRLFDLSDKEANRDNCLFPYYVLQQELRKCGFDLATSDIHPPATSELIIYNEMPAKLPCSDYYEKSYLLIFESELIRPNNWKIENHKYFRKVFTWNDDLIDDEKYVKINFSQQIPKRINKDLSKKETLCTLIAGNKKVAHSKELYSKRVEAIRWFEKQHPEDFDLYGIGWDCYRFNGPKVVRALNRLKPLTRLMAPSFPSYRGKVSCKKDVLEKYNFAICYENARDIPGYITEKIFDCFFAGCVPVYWGANNVTDHIPNDCFVDRRDFPSYEKLYKFLKFMSVEQYFQYIENIERFLNSNKVIPFSSDFFVRSIIENIKDGFKNK